MAVLLVDTLDGDSVEDFSMRVAEKWKIGHKGADNGLLFVAAIKDRRMRLEVGYGWEGVINDARVGDIIRGVSGFFRAKDYFGGVQYSIRKSRELITGSPADVRPPPKKKKSQEIPWWLLTPIVILVILSNFFRRRGVTYWGGGSSGGGGGGFSGGGGSFGGGGASGDW